MNLVVRRSGLKMWLMAMGGIPLLVIALDVLTQRRITDWLRAIVFRPEDTQIYEPRDVIYAWAMLLFAGFLVLWGLKELFVPTRLVECRDEGLALKIAGPFRAPTLIPWASVVDTSGNLVEDEGQAVPALIVDVKTREGFPEDPWGARWIGDGRLAMLAEDWAAEPGEVAGQIADFAVELAKRDAKSPNSPLGQDE